MGDSFQLFNYFSPSKSISYIPKLLSIYMKIIQKINMTFFCVPKKITYCTHTYSSYSTR